MRKVMQMEGQDRADPERAADRPRQSGAIVEPAAGTRARIDCTAADPVATRARRPTRGDGARRDDRGAPGRRSGGGS
jgi:hypothetical protein